MQKIAIVGDVHLGFRQYGMEKRAADFKQALVSVVEACLRDKIDTIIVAGDLFNNVKPEGNLVYATNKILSPLKVYGIDGNHDATDNSWLQLCGGTSLHKRIMGLNGISVAGLNWTRPANFMSELDSFLASCKGKLDILILHQLVDEFVKFKQSQISGVEIADKLKARGVKLVIMGDLHEAISQTINGVEFAYTGTTEINAINEAPEKSFIVVEADAAWGLVYSRADIKTRPFVRVKIQSEKDIDTLADKYSQAGEEAPLLILEYEPEAREWAMRAEALLKDKLLVRTLPMIRNIDKQLIDQLTTEGFERVDALGYLKSSITSFFDTNTEEYQLITRILEQPGEIENILLEYLKSKKIV